MIRLPATARALAADFRRDQGRRIATVLFLDVLAALSEAVGLLTLVPLIAVADGSLDHPAIAALLTPIADWSPEGRMAALSGLFLAAIAVRAGVVWLRDQAQMTLTTGYEHSLRTRFVTTIARRGWQRSSRLGEDALQHVLIADLSRASYATGHLLTLGAAAALLAIQGAVALLLSPTLSLIAGAVLVVATAIAWPFARANHRLGARITRASYQSTEDAARLLQGLKTAMAEGRAGDFVARFRASDEAFMAAEIALGRRHAVARAASSLLSATAAILLLLVGTLGLSLPAAQLIPLLLLFARLVGPARQVMASFAGFLSYSPSFARLAGRVRRSPPPGPAGSAPAVAWARLDARGLRFSWGADDGIGPLDLTVGAGEWVGLSGASGIGKTSLVDALAGVIRPSDGVIHLDGEPVDLSRLTGWAEQLAYVGQAGSLFNASLADNLGLKDEEAIAHARPILAATGVDRLAARLERGLDTPLGVRGARLSGGEAQRAALARALLRRPRLLLLDEATAALDVDAEARLFFALRALDPRPAIVLVAHRPESLALTDRIQRLEIIH